MSSVPEQSLVEVNNFQDIPNFQNEDEEAIFWDNHGLGNEILEQMTQIDNSIFVEDSILAKLRLLPIDKQQEVLDFTEFLYQKIVARSR